MKLGVIYKKSELELTLEKGSIKEIKRARLDERMVESHDIQKSQIDIALEQIKDIPHDLMAREDFVGNGYDAYVVLGGDGTVLDIAQYVKDTPLLTVQIDPKYSVGHYCQAYAHEVRELLDRNHIKSIPRMAVKRNDESLGLVLNEILYSHKDQADLAKYDLIIEGETFERRRSSGVLVATGGGSTGWMKNMLGIETSIYDARLQILERDTSDNFGGFANEIHIFNRTREAELRVDGKYRRKELEHSDLISLSPGKGLRIYTK